MLFTVNYVTLTRLQFFGRGLNLAEILVLFHIHFLYHRPKNHALPFANL